MTLKQLYLTLLQLMPCFGDNGGQGPVCSKICLATVLICLIFAQEKLHERFSGSTVFPAQNPMNLHSSKTCFVLITHLISTQTTKSWKMLMNNQFKAQSLNQKSYQKFMLSYFSVTCFKHVGLLWPISMLDRKQVRGYEIKNIFASMGIPQSWDCLIVIMEWLYLFYSRFYLMAILHIILRIICLDTLYR